MLAGGIIFILALFATYAAIALVIAIRQIKRAENALDDLTDADDLARVHGIILAEKELAAARKDTGGMELRRAAASTQEHGSHSHDGGF